MPKFKTRDQISKVAEKQLNRPLCCWGDQPKLTAAQVDALFGNSSPHAFDQAALGNYDELLSNWNSAGAIEDMPIERLPIDRPVRIEDLEPGDILRYCGIVDDHESWPIIGSEVVVKSAGSGVIRYSCVTKNGTEVPNQPAPKHCVAEGFSFVRRPGFAKVRDGYVKNGDTVYWLGYCGPEKGTVGEWAWERSNREHHGPWLLLPKGRAPAR
jgi:hypothetical protein